MFNRFAMLRQILVAVGTFAQTVIKMRYTQLDRKIVAQFIKGHVPKQRIRPAGHPKRMVSPGAIKPCLRINAKTLFLNSIGSLPGLSQLLKKPFVPVWLPDKAARSRSSYFTLGGRSLITKP